MQTLPKVLDEAKTTPVLAAGGITTGADIRAVLSAGASGAMLGTRFVATEESFAHQSIQGCHAAIEQGRYRTDGLLRRGWPNAPHRVLRNGTFIRWDAAGCPPAGKRPGEGDALAMRPDGSKVVRYSLFLPNGALTGNELLDLALYAGEGVSAVRDIPAASDLIRRLWDECVAAR
jgi:NAD(P)H-dependent flavin oxidoreductase YrpB (nitropropane dioxygenase family)